MKKYVLTFLALISIVSVCPVPSAQAYTASGKCGIANGGEDQMALINFWFTEYPVPISDLGILVKSDEYMGDLPIGTPVANRSYIEDTFRSFSPLVSLFPNWSVNMEYATGSGYYFPGQQITIWNGTDEQWMTFCANGFADPVVYEEQTTSTRAILLMWDSFTESLNQTVLGVFGLLLVVSIVFFGFRRLYKKLYRGY